MFPMHRNDEIVNVCYFRLWGFEITCYVVIDNGYNYSNVLTYLPKKKTGREEKNCYLGGYSSFSTNKLMWMCIFHWKVMTRTCSSFLCICGVFFYTQVFTVALLCISQILETNRSPRTVERIYHMNLVYSYNKIWPRIKVNNLFILISRWINIKIIIQYKKPDLHLLPE